MISAYLFAVILSTLLAVGFSALAIHRMAEAKWRKHPLARFTQQQIMHVASRY